MMDLDSAIQHCEEMAEEQEKLYRLCPASESDMFHCDGSKDCITLKNGKNKGCQKCASEHRQLAEWLKELKAYKEQSGDAISRQAVMDYFRKWQPYMATRLWDFEQELSELPPVSPQQRTGRWIIVDDCEHFIAMCSVCGRIEDSRMVNKYSYCHCGAKMQEVKG